MRYAAKTQMLTSAETVLTVQTHQHRVSLQLGDVDCIHLLISWRKKKKEHPLMILFSEPQTSSHLWDSLVPISVNQEEQELRLMVSKRTTWLGFEPWLMATHTRGYSCSGTTSISNTFRGLGSGKSKCCRRQKTAQKDIRVSHLLSLKIFDHLRHVWER